jgi:hypothetical protein
MRKILRLSASRLSMAHCWRSPELRGAAERNPDKRAAQPHHAAVREFRPTNPISLAKEQGVHASSGGEEIKMQHHLSKLIPLALVAAIGLGMPALAKSSQSRKHLASRGVHELRAQRMRGLGGDGSPRRAPTFGAPNPNSRTLVGGHGYDANLYVY